jgi:hypothetical protein
LSLSKTSFDTIEECRAVTAGDPWPVRPALTTITFAILCRAGLPSFNGSESSNPCNQFHRHIGITIEHGFRSSRALAAGPGEPMPAWTQRTDYETSAGCKTTGDWELGHSRVTLTENALTAEVASPPAPGGWSATRTKLTVCQAAMGWTRAALPTDMRLFPVC